MASRGDGAARSNAIPCGRSPQPAMRCMTCRSAWLLGRCGDESSVDARQDLFFASTRSEPAKRLARSGSFELLPAGDRERSAEEETHQRVADERLRGLTGRQPISPATLAGSVIQCTEAGAGFGCSSRYMISRDVANVRSVDHRGYPTPPFGHNRSADPPHLRLQVHQDRAHVYGLLRIASRIRRKRTNARYMTARGAVSRNSCARRNSNAYSQATRADARKRSIRTAPRHG